MRLMILLFFSCAGIISCGVGDKLMSLPGQYDAQLEITESKNCPNINVGDDVTFSLVLDSYSIGRKEKLITTGNEACYSVREYFLDRFEETGDCIRNNECFYSYWTIGIIRE